MSRGGIAAPMERQQYEQKADSAKYSWHVDSPFDDGASIQLTPRLSSKKCEIRRVILFLSQSLTVASLCAASGLWHAVKSCNWVVCTVSSSQEKRLGAVNI